MQEDNHQQDKEKAVVDEKVHDLGALEEVDDVLEYLDWYVHGIYDFSARFQELKFEDP